MDNRISVVIPALNEEKYIDFILRDLASQTYRPYEVIVVDGSSRDATSQIVRKHKEVKCIVTRANVAHQRHTGAKKAAGSLLVFLDADVRIGPDFLKNVSRIFNEEKIALACPFYLPAEKHLPSLVLYLFFNAIFFTVQKVMPSGAGSCIVIRRKTYFDIGGFEERYTYDDMHLLSKSKKNGKFKTLPLYVLVSNRRIRKMGTLKSVILYAKLSRYFVKNNYEGANKIKYPFGIYS